MTDPSPRRRNWTRIALVVSLGLNLAVAGLVAGIAFNGPDHGGRDGDGLRRYGAALPEPYRRDLVTSLRENRGDWRGVRDDLRGQRTALAAALTADPYDPAAVEEVLVTERALLMGLADRGTQMLVAQIARMDAKDRAAYAEALLRHSEHGRR